jgi:hypothetical protein
LQAGCGRSSGRLARRSRDQLYVLGKLGANQIRIKSSLASAESLRPCHKKLFNGTQAQHSMCHAKHDIVIIAGEPAIGMANRVVIGGTQLAAE